MKSSASNSRQSPTADFQFNRYCGLTVFGFAVAFVFCLLHGAHEVLPALMLLAAWTVAAFGVTSAKPAPLPVVCSSQAAPGRTIGEVADAYGASLAVEVLESVEGFYVGTRRGELPFSRESVEYFPSRAEARTALDCQSWTQRCLWQFAAQPMPA